MINAIKRQAADALSLFRLIGSLACVELILFGSWTAATWLLLALVISDMLDGVCARRWSPWRRWHGMHGETFDDLASSALGLLVPGAMFVRFYLADRYGWPEQGRMVYWGIICVLFLLGMSILTLRRSSRRLVAREHAKIAQRFLYGLMMFVTAVVMITQPRADAPMWKYSLILLTVVVALILYCARLNSRNGIRYPPI